MDNIYDVIVVGGGPAGLTASLYLSRAKYRTLVIEKEKFGGQITITSEIVNYPGVEMESGQGLTETMRRQAEDFGAEFTLGEVEDVNLSDDIKTLKTADGKEYKALGIVLAVGAAPRKLGFKGEKEFQGRGVAYCATCDGEFFEGREVLVIGGGFAAVEEAMFLTKYAKKITMFVITDNYTCAAGTYEKLKDYPDIETRFNSEIIEVGGEGVLTFARCRNNLTGEEYIYRTPDNRPMGVFVFAGYEPSTGWLEGKVELNEQGYIVTDADRKTSIDGVYAAGDVCVKNLRQVVTAVGDGAVAATSLEHYVSEIREKLNLPERKESPNRRHTGKSHNMQGTGAEIHAVGGEKTGSKGFMDDNVKNSIKELFDGFKDVVSVVAVTGSVNRHEEKPETASVNRSEGNPETASVNRLERNPEDKGKRDVSDELTDFVNELSGISSNVLVSTEVCDVERPYIDIRKNNISIGIRYYSVPGGHEFNSFVIALYNVAGPGQETAPEVLDSINKIKYPHKLQVMATLSCTNCPEVVMGTQKLAVLVPDIEAEMYDISHFPEIKDKYNIMAVPCMIMDEKKAVFGKKSLKEIVDIILEEEQP